MSNIDEERKAFDRAREYIIENRLVILRDIMLSLKTPSQRSWIIILFVLGLLAGMGIGLFLQLR